MGAIALVVGVIGLGAVMAVVVAIFVAIRSRRNTVNGGPGSGNYPHDMGYPPQQPMYPNAPSGQSHPVPPGQAPHQPNPYQQ